MPYSAAMKGVIYVFVIIISITIVAAQTTIQPAPGKLDYRNERADDRIPVVKDKRQTVHETVQATVVELLELYHDAKQCHWNMRGPLYFPLHENLDEYGKIFLKYADIFAERSLHVGMPIDGRTSTVASSANLGPLQEGALTDKQVLDIMSERIYFVGKRVRERIDKISKVDEVTSNKLQDLSYELDKMVWQLRVQMQ